MSDVATFTLELELEPSADSVRVARRAVESWAHAVGAGSLTETTTLLVSELATNAVVHGGKAYAITARWASPRLRVDVIDSSPPPGLDARNPRGSGEVGGWGLRILDGLAREWGVEPRGERQAVWFEIEDDSVGSPGARVV